LESDNSDNSSYRSKCDKGANFPNKGSETNGVAKKYNNIDYKENFEEDPTEDLICQVDRFHSDPTNIDINEPDVPEESGSRIKDVNYMFCPAPHRLPILRLFAKHHALHPLLPE
jgi:hypothetical protein